MEKQIKIVEDEYALYEAGEAKDIFDVMNFILDFDTELENGYSHYADNKRANGIKKKVSTVLGRHAPVFGYCCPEYYAFDNELITSQLGLVSQYRELACRLYDELDDVTYPAIYKLASFTYERYLACRQYIDQERDFESLNQGNTSEVLRSVDSESKAFMVFFDSELLTAGHRDAVEKTK